MKYEITIKSLLVQSISTVSQKRFQISKFGFIFPLPLLALRLQNGAPVFHPPKSKVLSHINLPWKAQIGFRHPREAGATIIVSSLQAPLQHIRPQREVHSNPMFSRDIFFFSYPGGVVEHPTGIFGGGGGIRKIYIHSLKLTVSPLKLKIGHPKRKWIFPKPSIFRCNFSLREATT